MQGAWQRSGARAGQTKTPCAARHATAGAETPHPAFITPERLRLSQALGCHLNSALWKTAPFSGGGLTPGKS